MNKKIVTFPGTFAFCFLLNLLKHNQISVAFANSLLLSLSITLFVSFKDRKIVGIRLFFLLTLAALPLFQYNPKQFIISLFPFCILLIWFLQEKLRYKNQLILIGVILIAVGSFISAEMISLPFSFNNGHSIFSMQEVRDAINQHQHDALYIPFRLRPLVYNSLVYIYYSLSRLADFLSLRTLYDIVLIANLYPLFWGMYLGMKNPKSKEIFAYSGILIALIAIGINKSPDKFSSFFIISPFLLYFILLGLEKVNAKMYLFLLLLSVVIFTGSAI